MRAFCDGDNAYKLMSPNGKTLSLYFSMSYGELSNVCEVGLLVWDGSVFPGMPVLPTNVTLVSNRPGLSEKPTCNHKVNAFNYRIDSVVCTTIAQTTYDKCMCDMPLVSGGIRDGE